MVISKAFTKLFKFVEMTMRYLQHEIMEKVIFQVERETQKLVERYPTHEPNAKIMINRSRTFKKTSKLSNTARASRRDHGIEYNAKKDHMPR